MSQQSAWIPASAMGERCRICSYPAARKIEEVIFDDDPHPIRHPLTAYLCLECFSGILNGTAARHIVRAVHREEPTELDGCPCTLIQPCIPECSCADSVMSGGCLRCAKYGSREQRLRAAYDIAGKLEALTRGTPRGEEVMIEPSEEAVAAAIDSFVRRPHGKNENWNRRDIENLLRAAYAVDFPALETKGYLSLQELVQRFAHGNIPERLPTE